MIKKKLEKMCLENFAEVAECLKLGIHEDSTNRTKIAELMRFQSSKSGDEQISLKEHVGRMNVGQKDMYCFSGASSAVVSPSPFLENLRKKGLEVLYMVNSVDEYAVQQLKEFDGKKLKSTTKEGLYQSNGGGKKKHEELNAQFEPLTKLQEEVRGDKVEKVTVGDRIVDSPERIMKAQASRDI